MHLPAPKPYIVRTAADLKSALREATGQRGRVGFDFETFGDSVRWRGKSRPNAMTHRIAGFSVYTRGSDTAWYVSLRHTGENLPVLLGRAALSNLYEWGRDSGELWAWNLGFELQVSRNEGVDYGAFSDHYNDASVSGWLAGWGSQLPLKATAEKLFPPLAPLADFGTTFGKDADMSLHSAEDVAPYACKDPWLTVALADVSMTVVEQRELGAHYRDIDMPMVEPLRDQQEFGVIVNRGKLEALRAAKRAEAEALALRFRAETTIPIKVRGKIPEPVLDEHGLPTVFKSGNRKGEVKTKLVEQDILVTAGADIGSDPQVSRWVYEEMKLWPTKGLRKNGRDAYPVDKETLERFTHLPGLAGELVDILLRYRRADKLCSTYLDVCIEGPDLWHDGRLHPSHHLTGTDSQRLSSSGPNFQNLPAHSNEADVIAGAIEAPEDWEFVIYDLSQIDMRVMAHASQDPALLYAYRWGEDVHARTLAKVRKSFPEAKRVDAKITNFSTIYRISDKGLAPKIKADVRTAGAFIDAFFEAHPLVSDYHAKVERFVVKHGYVPTADGFRRYFADVVNPRTGQARWSVINQAISTSIQGTAGGMVKISQRNLHRRWVEAGEYGKRVRFAGQIHDSLVCCAHRSYSAEVATHMEEALCSSLKLSVPIECEGGRGPTWGSCK